MKRGFIIWVLADAHTGYIFRFDVYQGKSREERSDGLGATVVKKMSEYKTQVHVHIFLLT